MSDELHHECGIALIRLLKPLAYYAEKYGTARYGLDRLHILMEKQHNRGQDGAGVGVVKLDMTPGQPYIFRQRSAAKNPILDLYQVLSGHYLQAEEEHPVEFHEADWVKRHVPFAGEVLMGHLRYGTRGFQAEEYCHPFLRQSNWIVRNLLLAGNFNLTNSDELLQRLVGLGQHPYSETDTSLVLEKIGHFLDEEVLRLQEIGKRAGLSQEGIMRRISRELDLPYVLGRAARHFDGGFALAGILGSGEAFVLRDAHGIRPAYYYGDDEIVVVASERPAIQTAFALPSDAVEEVPPGHALIIDHAGAWGVKPVLPAAPPAPCSFERIYFSRGTDCDIYQERKRLGRYLAPRVMEAANHDLEHTVFSFIPNTSEVAFLGLVEGVQDWLAGENLRQLSEAGALSDRDLARRLSLRPRVEKIMNKDVKLRTFITGERERKNLVSLVYDTTYGVIQEGRDTLVVMDDSIVRGTTLRESILTILGRLRPAKIVVVSSAPQIRYPDCYGIDMSQLGQFIAFEALVDLLKSSGQGDRLQQAYDACKAGESCDEPLTTNHLRALYDLFTPGQISTRIAEILRPDGFEPELEIIYQRIEDLHRACPRHPGDWYFTGRYPTPGGHRVANRAFRYYMEGRKDRAY